MITLPTAAAEMVDYNLGPAEQIPPGEGREFVAGGTRIAVFRMRLDGEVYATQAECPHRNGPLADGLTGGTVVVCPYHAWKFDLSTGEPILGECAIRTYPARVTPEGAIVVTV